MPNTSLSSAILLGLLTGSTALASGCGVFGTDDDATSSDKALPARDPGAGGDAPKAPPVGGPADTSELTNALGVFVATSGDPAANATREHPIRNIQAAIDLAKRAGKRVYVCGGTYAEAITMADSISLIGGLDCTANEWRTGGPVTRIESPTSPAMRASDVTSPTRIEGIELVAPNGAAPSASSVGLIAVRAAGLVIAHASIIAGNAAKGEDGSDGGQLTQSDTAARGQSLLPASECPGEKCTPAWGARASGGVNLCDGAPEHIAESGSAGGIGGVYRVVNDISRFNFVPYDPNSGPVPPIDRSGAPGLDGNDGAGGERGAFSREGYVPADGRSGTDGVPGKGGRGGSGHSPDPAVDANSPSVRGVWRGWSGAGGGAGGCPGLAGGAGKGGGASIAALLVDSPVTFDGVALVSGRGGDAGLGTFGSTPTAGGAPGFDNDFPFLGHPAHGGRGGAAGTSGNGSSGPSIAVAHVGPAPRVQAGSKLVPGAGGASIDARSRTDAFGITKTIPATPPGLSLVVQIVDNLGN